MSEHTKTPWRLVSHEWKDVTLYSIDGVTGALRNDANARHIVHCANNHERLVEALRDVLDIAEYISNYEGYSGKPQEYIDARHLLAQLQADKGGE